MAPGCLKGIVKLFLIIVLTGIVISFTTIL